MIESILGVAVAALSAIQSFIDYKKIKVQLKNKKDSIKALMANISRKNKVKDIERTVRDTVSEDIKKESQRIVI